jgi:hypothetical protein
VLPLPLAVAVGLFSAVGISLAVLLGCWVIRQHPGDATPQVAVASDHRATPAANDERVPPSAETHDSVTNKTDRNAEIPSGGNSSEPAGESLASVSVSSPSQVTAEIGAVQEPLSEQLAPMSPVPKPPVPSQDLLPSEDVSPGLDDVWPQPRPLDELRRNGRRAALPPLYKLASETGWEVVTRIDTAHADQIELTLLDGGFLLGQGVSATFQRDAQASIGSPRWRLEAKSRGGLAAASDLATLVFDDCLLRFQWTPRAAQSEVSARLKYCLLRIEVPGDRETCWLSTPFDVEPPRLETGRRDVRLPLSLDSSLMSVADHLRVDLELQGVPPHRTGLGHGLRSGETCQLLFSQPPIEAAVRIDLGRKSCFVVNCASVLPGSNEGERDPTQRCLTAETLHSRRDAAVKGYNQAKEDEKSLQQQLTFLEELLERNDPANVAPPQMQFVSRQAEWQLQQMREKAKQVSADMQASQRELAWCDQAAKLFDQIRLRGRLCYRVYVEVGDEVVEIVRAQSSER